MKLGFSLPTAGPWATPDNQVLVAQRAEALGYHSLFRKRLATRRWEDEQYVQAIAEWRTIASQEPANVEARVALTRSFLKTGDRGRALSEYRGVLALAPGHAEAKQSVAKLESKP